MTHAACMLCYVLRDLLGNQATSNVYREVVVIAQPDAGPGVAAGGSATARSGATRGCGAGAASDLVEASDAVADVRGAHVGSVSAGVVLEGNGNVSM